MSTQTQIPENVIKETAGASMAAIECDIFDELLITSGKSQMTKEERKARFEKIKKKITDENKNNA